MLVDVDRRQFPCRDENLSHFGKVETCHGSVIHLRTFRTIGAADLLEIDVGNSLVDGKDRMTQIVTGSKQALLFAEDRHEDQASFRPLLQGGEGPSNLDHGYRATPVV